MTWRWERLDHTHLDEVMTIERSVFVSDAWSAESMRAELSSGNCWYIGARDSDDSLVGYAGMLCPPGSVDADIQTIAVRETERGHGLGRALMEALLEESVSRGAREVFLEVRADNAVAQSLYASLGFEEIGRRPGYYQPDNIAAVVMRRRQLRDVHAPVTTSEGEG